jgi:hypothetical protein
MDIQSTAYSYPGPDNLMSAPDAVTWVLDNVGTNYPARDTVDARLVSEVHTWGSTGELISDETVSPMNGPDMSPAGLHSRTRTATASQTLGSRPTGWTTRMRVMQWRSAALAMQTLRFT